VEFVNNHEESLSILHINHDQSEMIDINLNTVKQNVSWNKVRHALKFSLRRKQDPPTSPVLAHPERRIPSISISVENDDDRLHDNKRQKTKKKSLTTNNLRQDRIGEDSDQEDESIEYCNANQKRNSFRTDRTHSSSNERQDIPTALNFPITSTIINDEDNLLARKQSKIGRLNLNSSNKIILFYLKLIIDVNYVQN
jgi:hypothetical protein